MTSAAALAAAAQAPTTTETYRYGWASWASWASAHGIVPEHGEPGDVGRWLAALATAGRASATAALYVAAVRREYVKLQKADGSHPRPDPTDDDHVREVLAGYRRTRGVDQRKAQPLLAVHMRPWLALPDRNARDVRDRAAALLCWCGGLRAAELVGLSIHRAVVDRAGLRLTLPRTKTTQDKPRTVYVARGARPECCPVEALARLWDQRPLGHLVELLEHLPLLPEAWGPNALDWGRAMSRRAVDRLAKRIADHAGQDAALYSAHSFRAGLATECRNAGRQLPDVQAHLGHRRMSTTAGYMRTEAGSVRVDAGLL